MKRIFKNFNFLGEKAKKKLLFIFFLNFIIFFLEFFSLVSIPIFATVIVDPNILVSKLENYFEIYSLWIFKEYSLIAIVSFFVFISFLIKNLFLIFLTYYQGNFFRQIKIMLSEKLFNNYINAPYTYHLTSNPSEISRNVSAEIEATSNYILHLTMFMREILVLLVIFILLLSISIFPVIFIAIILSFVTFFYIKKIKPLTKKLSLKNQTIRKYVTQIIYEAFGSIKDLKILNKEKEIKQYFNKQINEYEKNILIFQFFQKLPKYFLELFGITFLVVFTFLYLKINQDLTSFLPVLSIITISLLRFIPAFNSLNTSIHFLKHFKTSFNLIAREINQINNQNEKNLKNINNIFLKDKNDNFLSIENLSFSYPDNRFATLNNVNINIEEGSKIGITGKTGAGKSTLFHIMLGLFEPQKGIVKYKGKNIFDNLNSWRKEIGYISQNIYLLDGSIAKNIAFNFTDEKIDEEKLKESIKIAELSEKIDELPSGLNTNVGPDGLRLSGGERQRIALARAIYKNPNIFFLDESTSALDVKTEEKILDNIKNKFSKKTIIMIAHRESIIKRCDKVWNLVNGKTEERKK